MKTKITLLCGIFLMAFGFSQHPLANPVQGEYVFNPSREPCLSEQQRNRLQQELTNTIETLKYQNKLAYNEASRNTHPLFIWPVQKASQVTYNNVWAVTNYVDHNTSAPNALTDYNCGDRTYDLSSGYNHRGIDITCWPFPWHMMDNDYVEIIAAAPGQIIGKEDGNFDRSCDFNTTTPWNIICIQHNDGSVAYYGHLKNGSLTTKTIGDMVTEGEFLGIMGSSGISTGPHLHFETYADANFTQLIDPYAGTCNNLNTESWWQSQKPYLNRGVNAVLTHSAAPVFPSCPTTEITNISNQFGTDDTIYFGLYLSDQINGETVNLKIIKPDNTFLYNWDFTLTPSYYVSWLYWYFQGDFDMQGQWKWEATYGGETATHTFNVGALNVEEEHLENTSIYPNPVNEVLYIETKTTISSASIYDISGKSILHLNNLKPIESITTTNLSKGLYFLMLEDALGQTKMFKFIKK